MLTTLRIKNLALVTDLTLEFQPGYNVITGETGAGKSILIGALSLVLGERADRSLIRSGTENCSVEAVFDSSRLEPVVNTFLEENGFEPCEDNQLVLKRTFTTSGTNRQFINGSPAGLSKLSQLGEWLVDIHGPHEHQSLLNPLTQLRILDAFGGLDQQRNSFTALVQCRTLLEQEKSALVMDEKTYAHQLDLLRFQVGEISAAGLKPGEEEQIETAYRRASNSAKLTEGIQTSLELLTEEEASIIPRLGAIGRTLQELHRLDPTASNIVELHQEIVTSVRELQSRLSDYGEKVEVDPQQLKALEERLNLLQNFKRKYGRTAAEILEFANRAALELKTLEQRDTEVSRINLEIQKVDKQLWQTGQELSSARRKVIPQLGKAANKQLADLGFQRSQFDVEIKTLDSGNSPETVTHFPQLGLDTVEFQFAPNPGEPAHPLRSIASSGELARVMLALKTVLASEDRIPVLVFDEVDANVGGETANSVGAKMRQIARNRQVLCITHLPQVAAVASAHYVAAKYVKGGRSISEITLLDRSARVSELARMLGGQSEAARKHAEALLG
jgi:DNA repair protein RecN (Recombination protein N)